ncbi:MAG: hypothetical protein OEU50_08260 [Gammaproteobacteria bacterium]|nr:hypothetical protein [Gammaproteobacteria bacterium]
MPPIGSPAPGMPPMGMMPPMPGMGGSAPNSPGIMDPKQYEQFYKQWTDMMSNMTQPKPEATESQ